MAFQGTVKSFNDLKGWGFLVHEGKDVFIHIRECKDGRPSEGDVLTFDMDEDPVRQGQMKATNIVGCSRSMDDMSKGGGKGKGGKGKGTGAYQGPVKSFNETKGWGFIVYEGQDIFVHIRDCNGSRPVPGDWVTFDMQEDSVRGTGQMKATNVSGGSGFIDDGKGWGKSGGFGGKSGGYGPSWDKGGWGGGKDAWGGGKDAWGGGKDAWGAGPYGKGGGGGWGGDFGGGKGGFGGGMKGDVGGCKGGKGGFNGGGMKGGFGCGCGMDGMKGGWGKGGW